MKRGLPTFYFTLVSLVFGVCQQKDDTQELLDKALLININAKIMTENGRAAWSFQFSRFTIPGTPVGIELNGNNINLKFVFTPYQEEKEVQLLLLAQSQIWLNEAGSGTGKYLTSLKSIPVKLGEKIEYYPLGVGDSSSYNIQLDIEVVSYKDLMKKEENPLPKNESPQEKNNGRSSP
jgi:hypothetical protein